MKFTSLILLLAFFSCNDEKKDRIRVAGEGKIRMMPDLVILTLDVSFLQPRMVDAVQLTQQTVDSVVAILGRFGRPVEDIKTSSISANKEYDYSGNRAVFTGFKAQQTIDFVLHDISRFTDLTGKLLETRINSISNIQFSHSKADSILREADLLAYDDALKSAKKLCDRAEVKLGRLLFIANTETSGMEDGYSTGESINTYSKAYGGRGFKISPEVIEFRRQITSEFSISD